MRYHYPGTFKMIYDLEYIVSGEHYFPYARDWFGNVTGSKGNYAKKFPKDIEDERGGQIHTKININSSTLKRKCYTRKAVLNMYYDYGRTQCDIGTAIVRMLEYLEKRYGIDFYELEKQCYAEMKSKLNSKT